MMHLLNFLLMAPSQGADSKGSGFMSLLPLLLIIVVFYFFFIRPQVKKTKDQKKFRESLKEGDRVVTIGGVHGKIVKLMETTVLLEIADNTRIKIERSAIAMTNQEPSVENN